MSKVKIFSHYDLDGVCCVILAYLAFGRENIDVEYCGYDDVDEKVMEFFKNNTTPYNRVYITDISISKETAAEIDSRSWREKVLLFDHHATALGLNKYDWCKVKIWYDDGMPTSGTELFYKYLTYHAYICPANTTESVLKNIDRFVEIVRDYDTWRWKEELGEDGIVCKQMNDLFYIYGRDNFIAWAIGRIHDILGRPFPSFDATDELLLTQKQKDIDIYVEQKNKQLHIMVDRFGYAYGVIFAERYFSELGNRLCELHPELAYIVMIDICNGKVSYRSIRDDIDLGGEIAHSFGGGGHRKAAGSIFNADDIQETVLGELNMLSTKDFFNYCGDGGREFMTLANILQLTLGNGHSVTIYGYKKDKVFPENFVVRITPSSAMRYLTPKLLESEVRSIGVSDGRDIKIVVYESEE